MALRRQAAAQRVAQASAGTKQLQALLKTLTGANADAITSSGEAATKEQNARLSAAEKENPLNSPGTDSASTAAKITNDNRSWMTGLLPNSWRSDRGGRLNGLIDQLDPNGTLTDKQRSNLLTVMNSAFENTNLNQDPDKAALDRGRQVLDDLGKVQTERLGNTQAQINQRRATRIAQLQVLLQSMNGGNGQLDPMALQLLNQNIDDEE